MHHFSSNGVDIAYIDAPSTGPDLGQPIVLVHGFASSHKINWLNTLWVKVLTGAGRRVIALDNRGHGESGKPHDPAAYPPDVMAQDVLALMDHLGLARADVMGYSMGARISAHLALAHPERVRRLVLGGLGIHLVDGAGLPPGIADALEAPDPTILTDPMQKMFRTFADASGNDLKALAACIRGNRHAMTSRQASQIETPTLICVGTLDDIAGDPHALASLMPNARALDIPDKDHNMSVGNKVYKDGVLAFLS